MCCRKKGKIEDILKVVDKQCRRGLKQHYSKDMIEKICRSEGLDLRFAGVLNELLNSTDRTK